MKTDLLRTHKNGETQVLLSNGSSFRTTTVWTLIQPGGDGWLVGAFSNGRTSDISRYVSGLAGAHVLLSSRPAFEEWKH